MQHDIFGNCYYCGYGPQHRSPIWSNEHPGVCCVTHSGDSPEKATNEPEWRKFKRLPRNFGSGGGQSVTFNIKVAPKKHKKQVKSARKTGRPKKSNDTPPQIPHIFNNSTT